MRPLVHQHLPRFRSLLPVLLLAAAACADSPTAPSGVRAPTAIRGGYVGQPGFVLLKKRGPAPTYSFNFSIEGDYGYFPSGNPVAVTVNEWMKVWEADNAAEPDAALNIMEYLEPGMQLDSAWFTPLERMADGMLGELPNYRLLITGTNQLSVPVGFNKGGYVTIWNSAVVIPPPPQGGEGCTPGYWKQAHHFDSWSAPYTPNTLFDDVFANAFPGKTLVQVLGTGGGGLNALGRHTVAALLNAQSDGVSYELTAAAVIQQFNAAYASGDYETQKNAFAALNERECRLN